MKPQTVVQAFDDHLEQRGLRLEAVVIGGSALVLWPAHVRASLAELGRRLGHGV